MLRNGVRFRLGLELDLGDMGHLFVANFAITMVFFLLISLRLKS